MRVDIAWPNRKAHRLGDGMAEERARLPSRRTKSEWDRDRVALSLGTRRDRLVEQLPRELAAARGLTRDQMELVVDEAIDFMVTEYDRPIDSQEFLDRAFWATTAYRVKRVHEGRGATVRGGWQRVDVESAELAAPAADPASSVVDRVERQTLLEFTATLTVLEQQVLAAKYGSSGRELGRVVLARQLGLSPAAVRKAERSIARKLERFVAVVSAGTLCAHRLPQVLALAEERSGAQQARIARAHLAHCPACRNQYILHLRAVRSGELPRRLAELLPLPPLTASSRDWRSGLWNAITDWTTKPFTQEAASAGAQAAAGARGVGTVAAVKLVALCIGGAAAVGGGAFCVQQFTDERRPPPSSASPRRHPAAHAPLQARLQPRPSSAARALPVVSPTAEPRKAAADPRPAPHATVTPVPAVTATPASTVTTAQHEQAAAVSPPASTASSAGEFDPAPATAATAAPAAAPSGGGPEFP